MTSLGLVIFGLCVAWTSLTIAGAWQSETWPAAPVPFGLHRVVWVHLLGVLPFAIWSARVAQRVLGQRASIRAVAMAAGVLAAFASLLVAPLVRQTVAGASQTECQVVRLAWSWVLLVPWCIAAVLAYRPKTDADKTDDDSSRGQPASRKTWPSPLPARGLLIVDGVITALFALLPALYVQQLVERQAAVVHDALVNRQYAVAWRLTRQLAVLGTTTIGQQPIASMAESLQQAVAKLAEEVQVPLPSDASSAQRLARASQFYSLGQFDDVERVLAPIDTDPQAQLRLALTDEARRQFAAAADRYRQVIEQLPQTDSLDDDQLKLLRIASERRVNNLRRIGENRRAEHELLAGLDQWPQARDAFLLQLGFHYQMAGRTSEAIDFFQEAAEVNPQLKPQADVALAQLRRQAEGCLLRPTRGATR